MPPKKRRRPKNFVSYARKAAAEMGMVGDIVERWAAGRRYDFLGLFDFIFLDPVDGQAVGVQVTSVSNVAARIKKMVTNPNLVEWNGNGGRSEVWGFGKAGNLWRLKRREVVGSLAVESE